jgi:hypothetical protein
VCGDLWDLAEDSTSRYQDWLAEVLEPSPSAHMMVPSDRADERQAPLAIILSGDIFLQQLVCELPPERWSFFSFTIFFHFV